MMKGGAMFSARTDIRPLKLLAVMFALVFLFSYLQTIGHAASLDKQIAGPAVRAKSESIEEKWGIQIEGIRLSAAGYMLDFRYRVTDTQKAAPLFVRKTKPYLIDQTSDKKLAVPNPPKIGPLRTSDPPKANRKYFILFANPGRFVNSGNRVTVVIGDFRAEDLVVD